MTVWEAMEKGARRLRLSTWKPGACVELCPRTIAPACCEHAVVVDPGGESDGVKLPLWALTGDAWEVAEDAGVG